MEEKVAMRTVLGTAVAPVVWGSTYAVTQLWLPPGRPLFAAVMRILPAGVLLLLWVRQLPRGAWWGRAAVLGTLNHAVFFGLVYVAAYRLPSGLASTLTAVSPVVVMGVAWLLLGERQPWVAVLAALAGIGGVVVLVSAGGGGTSGAVDPVGVAASVGAVVSASVGFVLVRRWTPRDAVLATTAWQLVAGGLVLVPVALVVEGAPPALDGAAVLALLWLGLVGSVVGYVVWFRGLTRMDAGAVAVVGLLNPVVGTVLGVVLLGEGFGWVQLGAMLVVLGGVLVAQAPVRAAAAGWVERARAHRVGVGVPRGSRSAGGTSEREGAVDAVREPSEPAACRS
ncbi:EamA family transporter [Phycicoccus sp. MAQZ13P-2]|uniref:DMT family transporter n=1 Tax=Phycicoccus mangrovi TaxID=2840470 RepID=UPI001C00216F|nr:EamA family transporter [Phycicoccus mangrovi]MBT9257965.1 EamA family transporter [Phycicoccus mangrovi]MBT9276229.1 EamA family transporter [Phycicoccus mangrovi]